MQSYPLVNDLARDVSYSLVIAVNSTVAISASLFNAIPGSRFIAKYVRASYQHDPFRTTLEICLVFSLLWYIYAKRYSTEVKEIVLTDKVV